MQPVGLQNLPLRVFCDESAVQWKRQDLHTHQQTKKKIKIWANVTGYAQYK